MSLPLIRSHERIDYKRCMKKWFWKWRMGLVPKQARFGALELGTWVHVAMQMWYGTGYERVGNLSDHFTHAANASIGQAAEDGAPEYVLDQAEEIAALGEEMTKAYERFYGKDKDVFVIAVEIPLEFTITDHTGKVVAIHRLKPDMVYADRNKAVRLMENKTAAQIRTGHLVIDDQARPYGAMAERALKREGVIGPRDEFAGLMYNFLRKALPDERPTNAEGKSLNKNGTVSKKQPAPNFLRYPVPLSRQAKVITLQRIRDEAVEITYISERLRAKRIDPERLTKTPHSSCEKFCQFFDMCVAEEQGSDITEMRRLRYERQDPYDYEETTDVPTSFEIG